MTRFAFKIQYRVSFGEPRRFGNAIEAQILTSLLQTRGKPTVQRISTATNHRKSVARTVFLSLVPNILNRNCAKYLPSLVILG